jgi:hypothetical protein
MIHRGVVGRVVRGSLIGVVVAVMLVASPLVVVASANGRVSAARAPSSRAGAVGHLFFLAPVASFIMQELASNAISYGFGWVLGQFGQGSGVDPQIGEIQSKLQAIEDRLSGLQAETSALRGELAQGTFSGLVAQATPVIAQINQGMSDLDFIAGMRADDPHKHALTEKTLGFIRDDLLHGKQQELDARMTGEAGSDGLIVAAYKTVKANAGDFWTRLSSIRVRSVVEYYQSAEARLLLLRVEYMHAHPATYSGEYVQDQIRRVERMLAAQDAMLKPEPGPNVIADTRTKLDWLWSALFWPATYTEAEARWGRAYALGFVGSENVGTHWVPCYKAEIDAFVKGSIGDRNGWVRWLNSKIGGQMTVPKGFTGLWTRDEPVRVGDGRWVDVFHSPGFYPRIWISGPHARNDQFGVFFVRSRAAPYWY